MQFRDGYAPAALSGNVQPRLPLRPEDDLSRVPIFAEAYQTTKDPWPFISGPNTSRLARLNLIDFYGGHWDSIYYRYADALSGPPFDLKIWQRYFQEEHDVPATAATPAEDVLRAFGSIDPEMKEVERALANPRAYWPDVSPNDDNTADMNPTPLGYAGFVEIWRLRSVAYIENRQSDLAEMDFNHCLQFVQSLLRNPHHSYVVLVEMHMPYVDDILWEGLHRHAWSAAQLQRMESELAAVQLPESDFLMTETYLRLARLACRIEEFRLAHGGYPETLNELPDLPAHLDEEVAVTGRQLRYTRDGSSYRLYSIGKNGKDDGGVENLPGETPAQMYDGPLDYVWREP